MNRHPKTTMGVDPKTQTIQSPYLPMFDTFRNELDEHHDRRERIIKASRDITALSKKMQADPPPTPPPPSASYFIYIKGPSPIKKYIHVYIYIYFGAN